MDPDRGRKVHGRGRRIALTSPACAASSLFLFFWFAALCSCNGHANGYIAAAGATNAGLGLDAWDRCPQHVVVDRAARLVFVDNVKAGSTTVRAFFRARNSTWDCGDLGGGDQLTGHTHTRLKHPADQADQADHGPHHRSQIDGNGDAGPRSRPRPRHGAASNMLSGAADFADNRAHDSGPSGYDGCGFVWKLAGDRPGFGCRTTAGCFEQRDGWIWFGTASISQLQECTKEGHPHAAAHIDMHGDGIENCHARALNTVPGPHPACNSCPVMSSFFPSFCDL